MRFLWTLVKVGLTLLALVAVAGLGAFLTIQYATSGRKVEVPSVVGLDVPAATRKLRAAGLHIDFEEDERNAYDETVPPNHVLRQEPEPLAFLKQERKVKVTLSLGPRNFFVPRVVGQAATAAQVKLQESGLAVGDLVYAPSVLVAENNVIDQEPTRLPPTGEAKVNLLVSSGPMAATFVMPDLIGKRGTRARAFLEANRFRVKIEVEPYDGVPEGTVIRQKPFGGSPARSQDAVWLWVSRSSEAFEGGR